MPEFFDAESTSLGPGFGPIPPCREGEAWTVPWESHRQSMQFAMERAWPLLDAQAMEIETLIDEFLEQTFASALERYALMDNALCPAPAKGVNMEKRAAWMDREEQRLRDGTYKRTPWEQRDIYIPLNQDYHFHYPHVSAKDPSMLAYTPDLKSGELDKHVSIKPGRYLTKYYPELGGKRISELAELWTTFTTKPMEVHFARTKDEIQWVYETGPDSCMSHKSYEYSSAPIHPTVVYAAGDLAIGYLLAEDDDEHIIARAICWPEKKLYGRIYGSNLKLEYAFAAIGFERGNMAGARLLKIEKSGSYVCPYLDDGMMVNVESDCLRITESGDWDATETCGLLEDNSYECYNCGSRVDEDEIYRADDIAEILCEACHSDCFSCDDCCVVLFDHENIFPAYRGQRRRDVCRDCLEDNYATCEVCSRSVDIEEMQSIAFANGADCYACDHCFQEQLNSGYWKECSETPDRYHEDEPCKHEDPNQLKLEV